MNNCFKFHSLLNYSYSFIIAGLFPDSIHKVSSFYFYFTVTPMYVIIACLKYDCNYDSYKMINKNILVIFTAFAASRQFEISRTIIYRYIFVGNQQNSRTRGVVALFKVRRINAPRRQEKPDSGEFIVERYKSERAI